ncbi:MAG TPA: AraC family transcriptional regulator [Porticoccaceae bacterium]|nr:AraC family transcriptional regulator [Porticoccaceae bacterium]
MQCLFCCWLLCLTNNKNTPSIWFLAFFLLAHALIPINELILWGADFKFTARERFPALHFLPGIAYYLDGALLFLCFRSLVFRDFRLAKVDLLHLAPLAAFALFIGTTFYTLPADVRLHLITSESFVYSHNYVYMEFFSKLIRVGYAVACFVLISRYSNLLRNTNSNMEKIHVSWLRALVIGFLLVILSEVVLLIAKIANNLGDFVLGQEILSTIGLTGYYLSFILVNLLVFTAIRYFGAFEQVSDTAPVKKPTEEAFLQPEMAAKVDGAIRDTKIYMEPDITLDRLAEALHVMPRDLSMLINRHFGVNYYEFINRYRIEEAKRLLTESKGVTITDIYLTVGFNSKSVFYTFFKKLEGVTPTKYRAAQQSVL